MISFTSEEHHIKNKFTWLEHEHPYLQQLRSTYRLHDMIKNTHNDMEKVELLMKWVNQLWEHNGVNEPERSDPLSILEEVSAGKRFRCVEYAIVLNGCLNAVGLFSRVLALKTSDCETRESGAGHVVVEVFIPKHKKWVMADPQFNVVVDDGNRPLNAVELAQTNRESIRIKQPFDGDFSYYDWIMPYLYYFTINFDNRINDERRYKEKEQLMLVPVHANYPKVFQRIHPIGNVRYTHSVKDFYFNPLEKDTYK